MSSNNQSSNTGNTGGGAKGTNPMSKGDASRIQSTQVSFSTIIHWFPSWPRADVLFLQDKSGGDMSSGGFAARAQGAGDRNANAGGKQGGETKK
jgi:hypothetical protein